MILFNYYDLGWYGPALFLMLGGIALGMPIFNKEEVRSKTSRIILMIVGIILLLPGVFMLLFQLIHPFYMTRMMSERFSGVVEREQILEIDPLAGAAILYDVSSKMYSIKYIPLERIPKTDKDVRFIVMLDEKPSDTGRVSNKGSREKTVDYDITIVDLKNPENRRREYFPGGTPRNWRSSGPPPEYYDVMQWINDTITNMEK